ncbi:hypothetical protein IJG71_02290 [Candidatus Saccharibacteria bacterium]|nr:hypothetical protein [Candidatus Saccharibacteria bacterium]
MAENETKNKSGAGKFVLGALLGAVVGAVAGKFIKVNDDDGEDIDDHETNEDVKECPCVKEVEKDKKEKKTEKKTVAKKTGEKK